MIIALTGQRKSGKSQVAKILRDIHPHFHRIAFADAMKKKLAEKFNIPIDDLYSPYAKEKHRHIMQVFAEEEKKKDPSVWVDIVMTHIDTNPGDYIIDDLRFLIELEPLVRRQAFIIQVVADKQAQIERGALSANLDPSLNKAINEHISENDVATLPSEVITSLGGRVLYNNIPKVYRRTFHYEDEYRNAVTAANLKAEQQLEADVRLIFQRDIRPLLHHAIDSPAKPAVY